MCVACFDYFVLGVVWSFRPSRPDPCHLDCLRPSFSLFGWFAVEFSRYFSVAGETQTLWWFMFPFVFLRPGRAYVFNLFLMVNTLLYAAHPRLLFLWVWWLPEVLPSSCLFFFDARVGFLSFQWLWVSSPSFSVCFCLGCIACRYLMSRNILNLYSSVAEQQQQVLSDSDPSKARICELRSALPRVFGI